MTREEAKTVFLNRGYVEVEGGTIYDADKWRESCRVISEWLEQEPKTGRWIYDYTSADGHRVYHCSECGCYLKPKHSEPLNSFKWCSSCGAKMEVEQNG